MHRKKTVRKLALWASLLLIPLLFSPAHAQDCSEFSETFGSSPQHEWRAAGGNWVFSGGKLAVSGLGDDLAHATTAFFPSGFFRLDVDVELNDTSGSGMVGIYPFIEGDVFLDIGNDRVVDGLAAVVFASGNAYLLGWDVMKGEWYQSNAYQTTAPVQSIGIRYSAKEVVLRVNGSDTSLKETGQFDLAPLFLSTLWLMAQGDSTTTASFDNVCGGPVGEDPGSAPFSGSADPLLFPYYQGVAGKFTGFALSNYSELPAELEFRAYGSGGELLSLPTNPRTVTLDAGKQLAQLGHEIFQASPSTVQQGWVEVSSDNPQLGSFFQVGEADRLDGSVSLPRHSRNIYFTRLYEGSRTFRGKDAETFISIANPGNKPVTVELALNDTGSDRTVTRNLPAKGCLYGTLSELFGRSLTINRGFLSAKVTEGEGIVGFELLKFPKPKTWIGLNAAAPNTNSRLFSAQLASVPGLFTSLKLVNTGLQRRIITLSPVAEDGTNLSSPVTIGLAAGESFEGSAAEIFNWAANQNKIGSLRIEADGPDLVGDVIFGDSSQLLSGAALPLQSRLFTEGVFSQVANGLGLFTGLAFFNPGEADAQIEMKVYREDGTESGSKTVNLPAGRRISKLLIEYLPETKGQIRGYVHVKSSQPLVAQQLFGAAKLLSAVPPTIAPQSLAGPGGSSIQVADQANAGGIEISLESDHVSRIREEGETAVSEAIRITVSTTDPIQGADFHKIAIPISGTPDPNRLTAKIRLTTGVILPLSGIYNAARNVYEIELPALIDGWVIGVVESPSISRVPLDGPRAPSPLLQTTPAGWMTPVDWVTCEFHPINHTNTVTDAQIKRDYLPSMWDACKALSGANFRSPKLWITDKWNDKELDPPGRVVHIVNSDGSFFEGTWDEEDPNFSTDNQTEREMLSLGQIYVDLTQLAKYENQYGMTFGHIFTHELFHSVQFGYDFRRGAKKVGDEWQVSYSAYTEGTATPLAQTFQKLDGEISGSKVYVRELHDGEYTPLDEPIDNHIKNYYYKQDFWAWVAREYGNNDWGYTNLVFEQLGMATYGQFNKTNAQYLALYRKGTDEAFRTLFNKGFAQIYTEFALDRAYKHSSSALLRESEETNWKENKLADSLFRAAGKKSIQPESTQAADRQAVFTGIKPLTTVVAQVAVSSATAQKGSLPLTFEVSGGQLKPGGVQITLFKEGSDGIMISSGETKVSNISSPLDVSLNSKVKQLTILISNTYIENKTVSVTVKTASQSGCPSGDPVVQPGERLNLTIDVINTADVNDCPPWEDSSLKNVFRRLCVYFQDGSIQGRGDTCYSHPQEVSGTYDACAGDFSLEFELLGTTGTWEDWAGNVTGKLKNGEISGTWSGTQTFTFEGDTCQRALSGRIE